MNNRGKYFTRVSTGGGFKNGALKSDPSSFAPKRALFDVNYVIVIIFINISETSR